MADLTGSTVGRYSITAKIGEGGMAVVYRARDERLKREVALKLIRPEMFPQVLIHNLLERFEREAQALARLDHPNIVHVYDFGEYQAAPYLVMEYLPGGTLKQHLGAPMPYRQAAAFLAPIARALDYAHSEDIIHRDVKPANILFNSRGVPKLGDFGIAKLLGINDGQTLTGTGMGMGTPAYMAPEQWAGKTSPAVDIYALGVVLFELVSGKPPYQADSPAEIFAQVLMQPLPDITRQVPGLPPEVHDLLQKSMAKAPEGRFASMAGMAEALEALAGFAGSPAAPYPPAAGLAERTLPQTPPSPPFPSTPPPLVTAAPEITLPLTPPSPPVSPGLSISGAGRDSGATVMPPVYRPPAQPLPAPAAQAVRPSSQPLPAPASRPPAERQQPAPADRRAFPAWAWLVGLVALAGMAALVLFGAFRLLPVLFAAAPTQPPASTAPAEPTETEAPTAEPTETAVPSGGPALSATEEIIANPYTSPDPTTLHVGYTYGADTLDPSFYTSSLGVELVLNVYERLVTFKATTPSEYIPELAETYEISADGRQYTFVLRRGLRFHNGAALTASDVAYTFYRTLLLGNAMSNNGSLYQAFFGQGIDDISYLVDPSGSLYADPSALQAANPALLQEACWRVLDAVTADDDAGIVRFYLPEPYAPFLSVLALPSASILDQEWAAAQGAWDGSCDTWQNYVAAYDTVSPLATTMNGTGPFRFAGSNENGSLLLAANSDYWRQEPAWAGAPVGPAAFERIELHVVGDEERLLAELEAGALDLAQFSTSKYPALDTLTGEICAYNAQTLALDPCSPAGSGPLRSYSRIPAKGRYYLFPTFNVATTADEPNPFLGSGRLDGEGIPPDFFSDVHVRRALGYCLDLQAYIASTFNGSGLAFPGFSLPGMPGFDLDGPAFRFDLERCAQEFQASPFKSADGRSLWEVGFTLQTAYNSGSEWRRVLLQNLADNLARVNPAFRLELVELPSAEYFARQREQRLPLFPGIWYLDFYDPSSMLYPLQTIYSDRQNLPAELAETLRALDNQALSTLSWSERNTLYSEASWVLYDNAAHLPLLVSEQRIYTQRWVEGLVVNPAAFGLSYYPLWKR